MPGKSCRPSGTWAMPRRAMAAVPRAPIRAPSKPTAPRGGITPVMPRSSVVLPAPLAPTRQTISPRSTCRSTSHSTWTRPYPARRRSTRSRTRSAGPIGLILTQVGFDHRRIVRYCLEGAFRDLAAEVQHGHPLGEVADAAHHVVDEQDGDAPRADALDAGGGPPGPGGGGGGRALIKSEKR